MSKGIPFLSTENDVYCGLNTTGSIKKDERERYCKLCNKKLSQYNLNKYCFVHSGTEFLKDKKKEEAEKLRIRSKKAKAKYNIIARKGSDT